LEAGSPDRARDHGKRVRGTAAGLCPPGGQKSPPQEAAGDHQPVHEFCSERLKYSGNGDATLVCRGRVPISGVFQGNMTAIPLYLKTDAQMPRPADPEFYLVTQNGAFLCRNHPFFTSDVPTRRPIKALAAHEASCAVRYPVVKAGTLESIVGFFSRVYAL